VRQSEPPSSESEKTRDPRRTEPGPEKQDGGQKQDRGIERKDRHASGFGVAQWGPRVEIHRQAKCRRRAEAPRKAHGQKFIEGWRSRMAGGRRAARSTAEVLAKRGLSQTTESRKFI
jgi:hypothetical protein